MSNQFEKNGISGQSFQVDSIQAATGTKASPGSFGHELTISRSRRECLIGAAAGAAGLVLGTRGSVFAAEADSIKASEKQILQEFIDRIAVEDLILRERAARDSGRFSEMASCYHPDSIVDVSWFHGSGADFAAASDKIAGGKVYTYHQMGPSVVRIRNDRALLDTGCTVHGITDLDGCKVDVVANTCILWRAQRADKQWLIAGLRAFYISNTLVPFIPEQVPHLDLAVLSTFRESYRFIAYTMNLAGKPVRNDLPGVDKPETVAALRKGEQEWLEQG